MVDSDGGFRVTINISRTECYTALTLVLVAWMFWFWWRRRRRCNSIKSNQNHLLPLFGEDVIMSLKND